MANGVRDILANGVRRKWRIVSGTFRWRNKEGASGQGELFLTLFAKGIMVPSNGCVHPYHWASATTEG